MMDKLKRYRVVSAAFILSLVFVCGGWIWAYFALRNISEPLILHYSNYVGINQIGHLPDLSAMGIFGITATLINFLISLRLEERDRFLGKLMAAGTLFMSILIFIGFAAIISVN